MDTHLKSVTDQRFDLLIGQLITNNRRGGGWACRITAFAATVGSLAILGMEVLS